MSFLQKNTGLTHFGGRFLILPKAVGQHKKPDGLFIGSVFAHQSHYDYLLDKTDPGQVIIQIKDHADADFRSFMSVVFPEFIAVKLIKTTQKWWMRFIPRNRGNWFNN